ncbi:ethanolamine utilization protein EutN [Opitutaceae bacterium TAV4]|nr:ethanolamine utilization protein EutN [Opitutaceae bacterium TAV4]RRJ99588.1 ethanolamine utilization protein EutN [Opitutaceae bacterium TAV3]
MQLARIDGTITATTAHPSMRGHRTVICQPLDENKQPIGDPVLATDPLNAGLHQHILFHTDGSATRDLVGDQHSPLRNLVFAIVDEPKK